MAAEVRDRQAFSKEDVERLLQSGIEVEGANRCGSYLQTNQDILHATCAEEGIEVLSIGDALKKYDWLKDYAWKVVPADKDEYTRYVAAQEKPAGYVIIARKGSKNILPVQACLYLGKTQIQHVHNILIAEEGAELHIISGCVSGAQTGEGGAHYGISEFYVGKNAQISFTMIHTWGEGIDVYPRSAAVVEENGVFISNYVCMKPVRKVQMYPTARLAGENAVARFSSMIVGFPGSTLDVGSRAILEARGASAELITRAITQGGTIISRGNIAGKVAGTRGHLECKGLILKDGTIDAIPEIEGSVVGTELSHEAAVGRIAQDAIEYLEARGLSEEAATATIVRGFLDVKIKGLPDALQKQIDATIDAAEKGF
ncbi:MAG: SufD family Fe-S cluster assembly protein [Methanomicrobiales archaeon]|nr:SufD family Fe-S cluster assembly protein [Methanomicrobiales archaeon]MDI6875635.1 SufD family Fe-S cluster assembly protein [Methanomicrobiales archaeon]